jgi:hypothetical protein
MNHPQPVDSVVDPTGQWIATVGTFGLAAFALALVVRLCVQRRVAWPLVVTAGGTLTCLMEPLFDHLYGLWFPTQGQWTLFKVYGIHEPIWLPAAYLVIYGALAVLTVVWLQRAPTRATVWRMYAVLAGVAFVGEITYVHVLGVYNYQVNQPFVVLGYPLFLGFLNAMSALMAGIVIWKLLPLVQGRPAQWMLWTLPPMAFALDAVGSGMFYLTVRHSDHPSSLALHLTAITVVVGGVLTVHLLSYLVVAPPSATTPRFARHDEGRDVIGGGARV